MPKDFEIKFPRNGISELTSFGDQPAYTCRDAKNMRFIDPPTGRGRGSQRSGLSKYQTTGTVTKVNGDSKVQHLTSITYDISNVDYSEASQAEAASVANQVFQRRLGNGETCFSVALDSQGNVYAMGSTTISKFNSEGEGPLWSRQVPLKDDKHRLSKIIVDRTNDLDIYVASTATDDFTDSSWDLADIESPQEGNRIWKYRQDDEDDIELIFELEVGGFVPDLKVRGSLLYHLENHVDTQTGYICVWRNIGQEISGPDIVVPELIQKRTVAFPANSFDLNDENEIYVVSEPFTGRTDTPKYPHLSRTSIHWTPANLNRVGKRLWSWYRAEDLLPELTDGQNVLEFRDVSGHERHFTFKSLQELDDTSASAVIPEDPPLFATKALGDYPGLFFDADVNSKGRGLATMRNPSLVDRMGQRTAWPSYGQNGETTNGQFALFMVITPSIIGTRGAVIGQIDEGGGGTVAQRQRALNANHSSTASVAGDSEGELYWHDHVSGGGHQPSGGASFVPLAADLNTADLGEAGAHLVTVISDGGLFSGNGNSTKTRSLLRVDGTPIDRWESEERYSRNPVTLGFVDEAASGSNWLPYEGYVHEIICIDREDPSSSTEPLVLTHQFTGENAAGLTTLDAAHTDNTAGNATELEKIEGYLAHKYGIQHKLPQSADDFTHPFAEKPPLREDEVDPSGLESQNGILAKYGAGDFALKYIGNDLTACGYGIVLGRRDTSGDVPIFLVGPSTAASGSLDIGTANQEFRRVTEEPDGSLNSTNSTPNFSAAFSEPGWAHRHPFMAVGGITNSTTGDGADAYVYVPRLSTSSTSADTVALLPISGTGASTSLSFSFKQTTTQANLLGAYQVVLPESPNYVQAGSSVAFNESIVYGTGPTSIAGSSTENAVVHKNLLVNSSANSNAPRNTVVLGVSNSAIRVVRADGAPLTPSGSTTLLSGSSRYISSANVFGRVYFTDGRAYAYYDPILGTGNGRVNPLIAKDGGEIPKECRFFAEWRGRLVAARQADSPHVWAMSQAGDPESWAIPSIPLVGQPISGNSADIGNDPDIINTLIPLSDDYLIFGGDKSIQLMSGDPTAGGQFDVVTTTIGMSFGKCWAMDKTGAVYFFSSRGGVFRMARNQPPEPLSEGFIDRRMQDVDFSTHYVHAEWNWRDETVHFFQVPFGTPSAVVKHWAYDTKFGGWWEDEINSTDVSPTALTVVDGDEASDRILLVGGNDGHVRKWDSDADGDDTDDDGNNVAIQSSVLIGPLSVRDSDFETKVGRFTAELSDTQAGAYFEVYATDRADVLGDPIFSGPLGPGRNPTVFRRARGSYVYIKLFNVSANQRWAFENARVHLSPGGRKRIRSRG